MENIKWILNLHACIGSWHKKSLDEYKYLTIYSKSKTRIGAESGSPDNYMWYMMNFNSTQLAAYIQHQTW